MDFARAGYFYGFFTRARGTMVTLSNKECVMDLWFLGLMVLLSLLTWGGIVLCARLQRP
jgi:hypothetical protein